MPHLLRFTYCTGHPRVTACWQVAGREFEATDIRGFPSAKHKKKMEETMKRELLLKDKLDAICKPPIVSEYQGHFLPALRHSASEPCARGKKETKPRNVTDLNKPISSMRSEYEANFRVGENSQTHRQACSPRSRKFLIQKCGKSMCGFIPQAVERSKITPVPAQPRHTLLYGSYDIMESQYGQTFQPDQNLAAKRRHNTVSLVNRTFSTWR
eukprot:GEMP01053472.1.p1 GENE.GEMP01053472.1~~GEMP01053472.1.p1  ORF type:complete len:248 (+),score=19.06 GEMP01053472.1:111-746(+)